MVKISFWVSTEPERKEGAVRTPLCSKLLVPMSIMIGWVLRSLLVDLDNVLDVIA